MAKQKFAPNTLSKTTPVQPPRQETMGVYRISDTFYIQSNTGTRFHAARELGKGQIHLLIIKEISKMTIGVDDKGQPMALSNLLMGIPVVETDLYPYTSSVAPLSESENMVGTKKTRYSFEPGITLWIPAAAVEKVATVPKAVYEAAIQKWKDGLKDIPSPKDEMHYQRYFGWAQRAYRAAKYPKKMVQIEHARLALERSLRQ